MPTVLISKHTHQRGDVHITPKPDDTAERASSQSGAVHGKFRSALGAYAEIVTGSSHDKLKAIRARDEGSVDLALTVQIGGKPVTSVDLSSAIYRAVCTTYHEVRSEMESKLNRALGTTEIEYYESVVKLDTTGKKYNTETNELLDVTFKTDLTRLATVKSAVAAETKRVMHEQFGFPEAGNA